MNELLASARTALESELFTAGASIALFTTALGYVLFQARALPALVFGLLRSQLSVSLTIYGDQPTFHWVDLWLSRHPASLKARRVTTITQWVGEEEAHRLTLGEGLHMIRQVGRWWWVNRERQQQPAGGSAAPPPPGMNSLANASITLTTIGRSPAVFRKFIESIRDEAEAGETVAVFAWMDRYFRSLGRKPKRSMASVHLPTGQKEALLADLQTFLERRVWYAERGIPWRRGVLLEGPPGTGKTSLIFALASALSKPIYLINPSTLRGDDDLQSAMTSSRNGIVVLEDIDTALATTERARDVEPNPMPFDGPRGITLSGLLNAIDGIAAPEGRILFITSNHPDKLDAALVRHGRVDRREHLGLADEKVARAMHRAFFPNGDADEFLAGITLPAAPAAIQERLISLSENRIVAMRSEIETRLAS